MGIAGVMAFILLVILVLIIFYSVITSAIDNSRLARDIRDIKIILSKQYPDSLGVNKKEDTNIKLNIQDILGGKCPVCSHEILCTDIRCPYCGELLTQKKND